MLYKESIPDDLLTGVIKENKFWSPADWSGSFVMLALNVVEYTSVHVGAVPIIVGLCNVISRILNKN